MADEHEKNVVKLSDWKLRGKPHLRVNKRAGVVMGTADSTGEPTQARLERIRSSLDKINRLMDELRRISE